MKIKAFWISKNPFKTPIGVQAYSKTIVIDDETDPDLDELINYAIEDTKAGYQFDHMEIIDNDDNVLEVIHDKQK